MNKKKRTKVAPLPKITKLLLVEDGSADIDDLCEEFGGTNIKVVVLRQGAMKPTLLDLEESDDE